MYSIVIRDHHFHRARRIVLAHVDARTQERITGEHKVSTTTRIGTAVTLALTVCVREETTDRIARVAFADAEPIAARYLAEGAEAVEHMSEALIWH